MNTLSPFKRSPRTRTRKDSVSSDTDFARPPSSGSSVLTRQKTRPPPLQIIPELSENELDIDVSPAHSPATARPTQSFSHQPVEASRVTLSAYTFSIDDAMFMFNNDSPRSPALSASSSTSDGASSEDVLTPGTSDDEDGYEFILPARRHHPQRISIRPLCITKTRSLICQEDEDVHSYFSREEDKVILPMTEHPTEAKVAMEAADEEEQDFYTCEFERFVTLSPVVPSPISPARRDSLILAVEELPTVIKVPEPKPRGRSRHSKPLPLLPPPTPPAFSLPCIPTFPLVQTTAQNSIARRKRNIQPLPSYLLPLSPLESRPLPQTAVPLDAGESIISENNFDVSSCRPIDIKPHDAEDDGSIYSQASFAYTASASSRPLLPDVPETPLSGTYGELTPPRSSTDSDVSRSSTGSITFFASSTSSDTPTSLTSFLNLPSSEDYELESTQCLRSRWSSSTLGSIAVESPRTVTLLSPLRSVFGSRVRRVLLPAQKVPPQMPPHPTLSTHAKSKRGFSTTSSPLSTYRKHIRGQGSRSSTSSAGTSPSECESRDTSPSGLKRKPIPVSMFLRAT